MTEQVMVVAPPAVALGFSLGGAVTVVVDDESEPVSVVQDAAHRAGVVLVHHEVWGRLPRAARDGWAARTDVLIVGLPSDDGAGETDHQAALHRLLVRAVGYEISFVPQGETT